MEDKISVITPVYNAKRFLARLVDCVQQQKDVEIEHVIVDDCSTDGSREILQELALKYSNIKLILLEENGGPVVARNIAIANASGRFIAFLDADDVWLPEKSIIQSNFMKENQYAMTFTDFRSISEDGEKIGIRIRGISSIGFSLHHMTRYIGCLTVMIDRNIIPDFHFPDISPAYRAEDFLAWASVMKATGPAYRLPYDLARYSVVENSRSSNAVRSAKSIWKLYREVEKFPFVEAASYFVLYGIFTTIKRTICYPFKPRAEIDKIYLQLLQTKNSEI